MWGCYYYFDLPFIRSILQLGSYSLLIWIAIIIALMLGTIRMVKRFRNSGEVNYRDNRDSLEFLKIRYAKGEIDHKQFLKMKQILS